VSHLISIRLQTEDFTLTSSQAVPYRPLGLLKNLTESLGFQISHCYEELVFIEHNAFLLRMEEEGKDVSLFFNEESDTDKRDGITAAFKEEGAKQMLEITNRGTYQINANEADGTLDIRFLETNALTETQY
jgi:hypothetical protein